LLSEVFELTLWSFNSTGASIARPLFYRASCERVAPCVRGSRTQPRTRRRHGGSLDNPKGDHAP